MAIPSPIPRYSDARVVVRWTLAFALPIISGTTVAVALLPKPEPAVLVAYVGVALFVGLLLLGMFRARIPLVPST